jgi:hypothetical protein
LEKTALAFVLALVLVLVIESPTAFDYDYGEEDEGDGTPGLFDQPLRGSGGKLLRAVPSPSLSNRRNDA